MTNNGRASILFALAALAWFSAAALLPKFWLAYAALGVLNLALAGTFIRRHRSGRA